MSIKDIKQPMEIDSTVECIEALAKIVKENDLGKIKISTEDIDIIIEGKKCPPPAPVMPAMPAMPAAPAAAAAVAVAAAEPVKAEAPASGNIVTSPIIGTFYASPSPDKPPFVEVGKNVTAGDVVCIIESMKLMNEINTEFSGRVAEIYVKNGETVEYGQKIMRIE